ncbi:MAG: cation:proton antiporter [Candidatus Brocadiae bacterium]|nr:cation:proton antiporter [Candidatus Brocadiia bacterium]
MQSQEIIILFLSLATLLFFSRLLGEIAKRYHQPAVIGEIMAGILLGPTFLGTWLPFLENFLFPTTGNNSLVLNSITTIGASLFLLIAGMELDLATVFRQGKTAIGIGISGLIMPFLVGFILAWSFPDFLGIQAGGDKRIFALFFATVLSISALPVIAKTLMDLGIYRTDTGMMIIACAVFDDILGWIIFALILSLAGKDQAAHFPILYTILMFFAFTIFMLTVGRYYIHKILPWLKAHFTWPSGVLSFILVVALFCSAFTEWIGIHAIFGAFVAGVAIGDSHHLREHTRTIIHEFVSSFFTPLFFGSIGLGIHFLKNFDLLLTVVITAIAFLGKISGCLMGGKAFKLTSSESWALAFAMNARGAMAIILALVALQMNLINETLFVSLLIMSILTSMMSGPGMQKVLHLSKKQRFTSYLSSKHFISSLKANNLSQAIEELANTFAFFTPEERKKIVEESIGREETMPTGLENGVAIPHVRVSGLSKPVIAVGKSEIGIDFNSPDGELSHLIFLILTPKHEMQSQLEIIADIAKTLESKESIHRTLQSLNFTEFLAAIKTAKANG